MFAAADNQEAADRRRNRRLQLIPMEPLIPPPPPPRLSSPIVVHLKREKGVELVSYDIYIGRTMNSAGWHLVPTKWSTPPQCALSKFNGDRKKAFTCYEEYVRADPSLLAALPELAGKRLGCWCFPELCHGDILIKLFMETQWK